MGRPQVVAQLHRPHQLHDLRHRKHVTQRLTHLLPGNGHPVVMHPIAGEPVAGSMRLGDLVLVVGELQVEATSVNIELGAQIPGGHGGAFEVPARPAITPRCGPRGLPRFRRLPQGEILRAALAHIVGFALLHVDKVIAGQRPIVGAVRGRPGGHIEVDRALGGVGETGVDKPLHVGNHLGHVSGSARLHGRRQHAQHVVGVAKSSFVSRHPFPPGAIRLSSLGENLIVDVGHVTDKRNIIARRHEPPAHNVEGNPAAHMPNMWVSLRGGATQIHGGAPWGEWDEITKTAGSGVEYA